MTQNQIAYWSLEETKRANKVDEGERHRHNVASESEINRHNVATEYETNRHNVATELLTSQSNSENVRHNQAQESIATFNAEENARANQEREAIQRSNIDLGYANVGLGYSQLAESSRHSMATEKQQLLELNETKEYHDETYQHWNAQDTNDFLKAGTSRQQSSSNTRLNESEIQYKKNRTISDLLNAGSNAVRTGAALSGNLK